MYADWDPDMLLSLHRMHYCSAAERDEWAAVLDDRELQATLQESVVPDENPTGEGAPATSSATPASGCLTEAGTVAEGAAGAVLPPGPPADANFLGIVGGCGGCKVLVAIELGSHCTRAVLHDGNSELVSVVSQTAFDLPGGPDAVKQAMYRASHHGLQVRLTYDTMLGQTQAPHSGGSSSSEELHPEALQRTLDAIQRIMATATAAAAAAVPPAAVPAALSDGDGAFALSPLTAVNTAGVVAGPVGARTAPAGALPHGRVTARVVATAAVRGAGGNSRAVLAEAAERLAGVVHSRLPSHRGYSSDPCVVRVSYRASASGVLTCAEDSILQYNVSVREAASPSAARHAAKGPAQQKRQQHEQPPPAPLPDHLQKPVQQQQSLLVVDMGGRSTEFVYGTPHAEHRPAAVSVPLGCVSLSNAASHMSRPGRCPVAAGEPSLEGLQACVRLARETVERSCSGMPWLPARKPRHRMATTATTAVLTAAVNVIDSAAISAEQRGTPAATSEARAGPSSAGAATAAATCTAQSPLPTASLLPPPLISHVEVKSHTEGTDGSCVPVATAVVFTGGTITTLAALHQQLPYYDRARVHGSVLTSNDIVGLMMRLADVEGQNVSLQSYDWLTEARCRTLAAGCAGLLGVMEALGVDDVVVSDADLLDGLLYEML
ncbi:hypothetical protein VOLCADRAFT_90684 [Volvox carteri f. nagariensis]|uniref:Uncharacterized protein n=1 Tax=Volvox carteri f. nagariensis TaxID=3068 RepID=D8TVG0_VOLCA|nr:uncharacterized protein VOLCADRAFT_90684 [Volvox carteri f. nagariensis]EFJ48452.1 hypothetical protein VOLCADRAFT_90684 [Volvox carteri f. nagariensis]|eukprot:XP_002950251.1 hypothetical protein VOLCADRAFT_90684 [Volvox carteri f. nagariensis]